MREWKRIFCNRFWGMAVLILLVCSQFFYVSIQSDLRGVDRELYNKEMQGWRIQLQELTQKESLLKLERAERKWMKAEQTDFLAEMYVTDKKAYESVMRATRAVYPEMEELVQEALKKGEKQTSEKIKATGAAAAAWKKSLQYVAGYEEKLDELDQQALRMERVPIFSNPDSFEYRNIQKTVRDFESMKGQKLTAGNDNLFMSVIDDNITSICGLLLLLVTVILFFDERRYGLETAIFTTPAGRGKLTVIRMGAIFAASFLSVFLFYVGRIFFSMWYYGESQEWGRLLQSVEAFEDVPIPMTIGQFYLLYGVLQWMGFFLIGLMLWALLSLFKNLNLGIIVSAGILMAEYSFFLYSKSNEILGWMRSINIFTCISMRNVFYRYLNYEIFGQMVTELLVVLMVMAAAVLVFGAVCGVRGALIHPNSSWHPLEKIHLRKKTGVNRDTFRTIGAVEHKKVWIIGKGLLVFIIFIWFCFTQVELPFVRVSNEERFEREYLNKFEGPLTDSRYHKLLFEQKEAKKAYEELLADQGDSGMAVGQVLEMGYARTEAMDKIVENAKVLMEKGGKNTWLLRDYVYEELYGNTGMEWRIQNYGIAALAMVLILVPIFGYENQNGMRRYLLQQPEGRGRLLKKKVQVSVLTSAGIWLLVSSREWYLIRGEWGGFPGFSASGYSLMAGNCQLQDMPIYLYLMILYATRLLALTCLGMFIMLVSLHIGTIMKGICLNIVLLGIPVLLGFLPGLKLFESISLITQAASVGIVPSIWRIIILVSLTVVMYSVTARRWRCYSG